MQQPFTPHERSHVGQAVGRLRTMVLTAAGLLALSLLVQLGALTIATTTDLRTRTIEPRLPARLIVTARDRAPAAATPALDTTVSFEDFQDPIEVPSRLDGLLRDLVALGQAVGGLACLVLSPIVFFGVMLAATHPNARMDRAISALIWAVVLNALCLPLARTLGLPWEHGALRSYETITSAVTSFESGLLEPIRFYGDLYGVPLLCLFGTFAIVWRFSQGVQAVVPELSPAVDLALEQEAANRKPGSLMGAAGRSSEALGRTLAGADAGSTTIGMQAESSVQAEDRTLPRRLI